MDIESQNLRIDLEDWRKAPGILADQNESNSAFASRDYKISCDPRYLIARIKGYHLWWCSTHHQPHFLCENTRLKLKLKS